MLAKERARHRTDIAFLAVKRMLLLRCLREVTMQRRRYCTLSAVYYLQISFNTEAGHLDTILSPPRRH